MNATRFAPSPTGRLHLGHALAARVAWELARRLGGRFLLRHEDIDGGRVREECYGWIEDELRWLGLVWEGEPLRQTRRAAAHEEALATLREAGVIYPCFCTRREIREEVARMAAAPQGPEGALYPGSCRGLDAAERERRIAAGEPHAWRLDAAEAARRAGGLEFHDLLHGRHAVEPALLGDVVLGRKDIGPSYHLAVVVDDAFQGVSHVTRGDDLLPSTHVHRLLQQLLGLPEPIYLHHPLVRDAEGRRLAKRDESLSLAALRDESGLSAAALLARLEPLLEETRGCFPAGGGFPPSTAS